MNKLTTAQLQNLTNEMNEYMTETGKKRFPASRADELATYGAKRCSGCTSVKLIEEFSKNSRNRDGLQGHCQPCHCAGSADYQKRNRDKVQEYARDYYEQNREYYSDYYEQNKEKYSEYHRTKYRTNENHRLGMQLTDGYHRAVRSGNTADWITAEELLTYWDAKGIPALECYLTSEELTPQNRSVDHVIAISNGGSHTVDNLMPATFAANLKKNNLEPDEAKELFTND